MNSNNRNSTKRQPHEYVSEGNSRQRWSEMEDRPISPSLKKSKDDRRGKDEEEARNKKTRKRRRSKSFSIETSNRRRDRQRREQSPPDDYSSRHRRRQRYRDYSDDSRQRQSPSWPRGQESASRRTGVVSDDDDLLNGNRQVPRKSKHRTRGKKKDPSPSAHNDAVGHFQGSPGDKIVNRYRIAKEVGVGTFGRVLECIDLSRQSNSRRPKEDEARVAVKIVRSVKRYYDSAVIEARIVQDINRQGGRGRTHCVVMHETFSFDGHFCMVLEKLGPSLYDFMKRHSYKPFPMICVQDFAVQLLETLEFLHRSRLIHTDLKIENILLTDDREVRYKNQAVPASTRIKVIDFGGACYDDEKKSSLINTRQYRAPEVILGTGWNMPSDMWSLGCILAELYQGELLFATHDNGEHLGLIQRVIGPFPTEMIRKAQNVSKDGLAARMFDVNGRHRMERVLAKENVSFISKASRLESIITKREDKWFLDLLRQILVIDPRRRSTAHECLLDLSTRSRQDMHIGGGGYRPRR